MVHSPTNLHGLLLQHAHARSGLAGVQHVSTRSFQTLHVTLGHSGDTAHALHNVKHETLGLQQGAHLARHNHGDITFLHVRTIFHQHFNPHGGVKTGEYTLGYFHACQDAFFLDEQLALAHGVFRNTAQSSMVSIADILGE